MQKQLGDSSADLHAAKEKVEELTKIKKEKLVLRAPASGVIGTAPDSNDIGRMYEMEREQDKPFCTIIEPNKFRVCLPLSTAEFNRREEIALPTEAALKTIHNCARRRAGTARR